MLKQFTIQHRRSTKWDICPVEEPIETDTIEAFDSKDAIDRLVNRPGIQSRVIVSVTECPAQQCNTDKN